MTGRIVKGAFQAREQYSTSYTSTVAGTVRYKGFLLVSRRRLAGPDDWGVGPVTPSSKEDSQSQDVRKGALWQSRWHDSSQSLYWNLLVFET
jgi:hypothetical protein